MNLAPILPYITVERNSIRVLSVIGPLAPLNTPLTILQRLIPQQLEINKLPFSTNILHIYNFSIHTIELANEYQYDIYVPIT